MTYIHVLFSKGGFFDALYKVYDLTGDMDGEAVNERMDQLRMGKKRAQDNGTAEPTGPPVERFSYNGVPKENTDIPYQLYRKLISKRPISSTKKDKAKARSARKIKYRGLMSSEMPGIDFFAVEEYNKVNDAYEYGIRNYGIDDFQIIMKRKVHGRYDGFILEVEVNERISDNDHDRFDVERDSDEGYPGGVGSTGDQRTTRDDASGNQDHANDKQNNDHSSGDVDRRGRYSVNGSEKNHQDKFSFAGEQAQTADLDALERAKEMQAAGVADETIRQETGWSVGMDGKWHWEIDDGEML